MPHQPTESPAKGEESGSDPPSATDMFMRLAKGLLAVTPEEMAEQERLYRQTREDRKREGT